jgi:hypothetical protein
MRFLRFGRRAEPAQPTGDGRPADPRRSTGPGEAQPEDLIARFGYTCPVCGGGLGAATPWSENGDRFAVPPGIRLEVGAPDGRNRSAWRVSLLDGRFPPIPSEDPRFTEHDVDYVYVLCGGGHIFPDSAPVLHHGAYQPGDARQQIQQWNMIAAVGAPASGKTYLLLRMLYQDLDNINDLGPSNMEGRVEFRYLSPLERVPLAVRLGWYDDTRASGHPMPATNRDGGGMPAGLLGQELPEALDKIRELIQRTVLDGARRAAEWGMSVRQPLVVRSDTHGVRTWTGLADLPGELFLPGSQSARQQVQLRNYDGLIWVLDPAVAGDALDRMVEDGLGDRATYTDVLDGSLRPGATATLGPDVVRTNRDQIQVQIGEHLSVLEGPMTVNIGQSLDLMVAVTKCDLIRTALQNKNLSDLGEPGAVASGVAGYLGHLVRRREREGPPDADPDSARLVEYLYGAVTADEEIRRRRIRQLANGLIEHYSDQRAFWNLVHEGRADQVRIPGGPDHAILPWPIQVPSIATHLDQAVLPGAAGRLHLRDLVMSAVGCGVAYGLGYQAYLFRLLHKDWMNCTFYLCSPLTTVPVTIDGERLTPLGGGRFPRAQERSAALTQLYLTSLRKARR